MKIKFMLGGGDTSGDTTRNLDNFSTQEAILANVDPRMASMYRGDSSANSIHWGNRYLAAADVIKQLQELSYKNGMYDLDTFKYNASQLVPNLRWNSDSLHSESIPALVSALVKSRAASTGMTPEQILALIDVSTKAALEHAAITNGGSRIDPGAWGYSSAEKPYAGNDYTISLYKKWEPYKPLNINGIDYRLVDVNGRSTKGGMHTVALRDTNGNLYEAPRQIINEASVWNRTKNGLHWDDKDIVQSIFGTANPTLKPLDLTKYGIGTSEGNKRNLVSRNKKYDLNGLVAQECGGKLKKILF